MKKIEEIYKALVRFGVGDYIKIANKNTLVCIDEVTADAVIRVLRENKENINEGLTAIKSFEDGKTIIKLLDIEIM